MCQGSTTSSFLLFCPHSSFPCPLVFLTSILFCSCSVCSALFARLKSGFLTTLLHCFFSIIKMQICSDRGMTSMLSTSAAVAVARISKDQVQEQASRQRLNTLFFTPRSITMTKDAHFGFIIVNLHHLVLVSYLEFMPLSSPISCLLMLAMLDLSCTACRYLTSPARNVTCEHWHLTLGTDWLVHGGDADICIRPQSEFFDSVQQQHSASPPRSAEARSSSPSSFAASFFPYVIALGWARADVIDFQPGPQSPTLFDPKRVSQMECEPFGGAAASSRFQHRPPQQQQPRPQSP